MRRDWSLLLGSGNILDYLSGLCKEASAARQKQMLFGSRRKCVLQKKRNRPEGNKEVLQLL